MKYVKIKKSSIDKFHKFFYKVKSLNTRKYHFIKFFDVLRVRLMIYHIQRLFSAYMNDDVKIKWHIR